MQSRRCSTLAAAAHILRSRNPFLRSLFVAARSAATGKEGSSGDHGVRPPSRTVSSVAAVKRHDASSNSRTSKVPHNHGSVVELFLSHGLTRDQIEKVIAVYPKIHLVDLKRTLKPKMDFLSGEVGLSGDDIAKIVTSSSVMLRMSLEKMIRPNFALLSSVLGSNQHVVTVLKRSPKIMCSSLEKCMVPKVEALRGIGVSDLAISRLTRISPRVLTQSTERFHTVIERVRELGLSPTKNTYVMGLLAVSSLGLLNLNRKLSLYMSFGFTDDQVLSGFSKNPLILTFSDRYITNHMDFLLNNLKWNPRFILSNLSLLTISLERRLIPRAAVRSALISKGFLDSSKANVRMFLIREDLFLEKYVAKFENACPGLLDTYQKAKETAPANLSGSST